MAEFQSYLLRFQRFPRTVLNLWVNDQYTDGVLVALTAGLAQEKILLAGNGVFPQNTTLLTVLESLRCESALDGPAPELSNITLESLMRKRKAASKGPYELHGTIFLDDPDFLPTTHGEKWEGQWGEEDDSPLPADLFEQIFRGSSAGRSQRARY